MFYMQDSATGKQTSLRTKDEAEANSLLNARNAAQQQPTLNLHLDTFYQAVTIPLSCICATGVKSILTCNRIGNVAR